MDARGTGRRGGEEIRRGYLTRLVRHRLHQLTFRERVAARAVFGREVLDPAMARPAGLARLEGLREGYLSYVERGVFPGGCFFAHLLAEFDAVSGPIHDSVVEIQRGWTGLLESEIRTAQERGELVAAKDPAQLAFELYAALELANFLATLYRDPSVVGRGRHAVRVALGRAPDAWPSGSLLGPR